MKQLMFFILISSSFNVFSYDSDHCKDVALINKNIFEATESLPRLSDEEKKTVENFKESDDDLADNCVVLNSRERELEVNYARSYCDNFENLIQLHYTISQGCYGVTSKVNTCEQTFKVVSAMQGMTSLCFRYSRK